MESKEDMELGDLQNGRRAWLDVRLLFGGGWWIGKGGWKVNYKGLT